MAPPAETMATEATIPVKRVEEKEVVDVLETNKENTSPLVETTAAPEQPAAAPTAIVDPAMQKTYGLVVKQVEFYFSDSNLAHDKFMKESLKANNGWISMSVLMTFNRLKAITSNPAVVVAALKQGSSIIQVSEDGSRLRRQRPMDAPEIVMARSVYAKGFPTEPPVTLEALETFFAPFGTVKFIKMRREQKLKGPFKGSVFVEYSSKEEAEAFVAKSQEAALSFEGTPLLVMTKTDYVVMKKKEYDAKEAANPSAASASEKATPAESEVVETHPKDALIAFDLTEVSKESIVADAAATNTSEDSTAAPEESPVSISSEEDKKSDEGGVTFATVKEFFNKLEPVRWVKFEAGQRTGLVLFSTEGSASKLIASHGSVSEGIAGQATTLRAPIPEEETSFWAEFDAMRSKFAERANANNNNKRRGGGRGRGGNGKRARR